LKTNFKTDIVELCRASRFPDIFDPQDGDLIMFCKFSRRGSLELGRFSTQTSSPDYISIEPISGYSGTTGYTYYPKESEAYEMLTYKFLDENLNTLCRELPTSSIYELLNLSTINPTQPNGFHDRLNIPIQVGDIVCYVHNGWPEIKTGRVEALNDDGTTVRICNLTHKNYEIANIRPREVCVFPATDEDRTYIRSLSRQEVHDFFSVAN
jgi:hypothetical protein